MIERANAAHPSRSTASAAVEQAALRAIAEANATSAVVTLVDRTGPRFSAAYGVADLATGRPARVDDVVHLFSGTKLFTAVALVQLAERGLLRLDDPVGRHLEVSEDVARITLAQLASHRSGLREGVRALLTIRYPDERPLTSAEALSNFPLRVARPPGGKVEYRNVNYALLGEVISRVAGHEYRDALRRSVLDPLGADLSFTFGAAARERATTGYLDRWDPMRLALWFMFRDLPGRLYGPRIGNRIPLAEYSLATASIGGLVGTVPEFAKLLTAFLADGSPILAPESARLMCSRVGDGAAGIASRDGVGIGWKLGRTPTHAFLNHEGGGAGFTTELRLYPEAGIGVAIALNAMRMPRTMLAAHALAEVLHRERAALVG